MKTNQASRSREAVRLQDVAALAKVAPITVSRAIRTPDKVSEPARKRIAEAIEQLGYVPNLVAGSLASNRTNLVAALVPNIGNPLFGATILGLTEALRDSRLHVMVGNTGHSMEEEEALVMALLSQRPCGILLHQTTHSDRARRLLSESGICVVETGDLLRSPIDSNVSYSSFAAAKALTLHALERGYRRIAYVSSTALFRTKSRNCGYKAALAEHGIAHDPALTISLPHTYEAGAPAIERVLAIRPKVDCVLFSGIATAIAAMLECGRRSIDVPGELAIATFDDNELAQQVSPALTALQLPRYEIGRRAGRIIAEFLTSEARASTKVDLGFRIVHRAST